MDLLGGLNLDLLDKSPQIVLLFFLGSILLFSMALIIYSIIFSPETLVIFVGMTASLGTAMTRMRLDSNNKK